MIKKQVRKLERRDKMDKIKQFVYKYQQLTKEEKKQIIKESSIEFLIAACSYGKMLGIDMAKEVKVLQNEIGREVLEDLVATEKDAKIVLENYLKKKIALVLDPTLLMNEKEWGEIADFPLVKRPYIFVYLLGNNLNHKKMIKQYAKWKNLEIVYIPHVHFNYQFSDNGFADTELYDVGPKEFLGLIQNATEVITDSFHGCVFSIIFKKQFCAFKRHRDDLSINMNTRLYTLLDSLNLRNRLIDDDISVKDIQKVMLTSIDYEKVGEILVELRKQSLDYLMSAISGDKR